MSAIFTDANFRENVLEESRLTVVDFWATWCPPCVAMAPAIDSLSRRYEGRVNIGKLNADENPETCIQYGVTNLPVILFLKKGVVVDRQVGAVPERVLDKKIQKLLE